MSTRTLVNCGHYATPTHGELTTGYGTTPDGYTLCFACCGEDDRAALAWRHELTAYQSGDNVTDWPGFILGRIEQRHTTGWQYTPTGGEYRRTYVTVRDVHGQIWRGSGPADTGTYVNLRKVAR